MEYAAPGTEVYAEAPAADQQYADGKSYQLDQQINR